MKGRSWINIDYILDKKQHIPSYAGCNTLYQKRKNISYFLIDLSGRKDGSIRIHTNNVRYSKFTHGRCGHKRMSKKYAIKRALTDILHNEDISRRKYIHKYYNRLAYLLLQQYSAVK